jgi:hypothetical protein
LEFLYGNGKKTKWVDGSSIKNKQLIQNFWKKKAELTDYNPKLYMKCYRRALRILAAREVDGELNFLTLFEGIDVPVVVPYKILNNMNPSLIASYQRTEQGKLENSFVPYNLEIPNPQNKEEEEKNINE